MWLRFAAHGDVAYLRGVDQAFYRKHPDSMLRTIFNAPLADLTQRRAAFDAVFEAHGECIRDAGRLQNLAHRALAREALWAASRAFDRRRLDQVSVDDLEAFARATFRRTTVLREYWGLRWRRRLGPRWCPRLQAFLPSVAVHHIQNRLWWRRWNARGV
jgi:hypothetical protein